MTAKRPRHLPSAEHAVTSAVAHIQMCGPPEHVSGALLPFACSTSHTPCDNMVRDSSRDSIVQPGSHCSCHRSAHLTGNSAGVRPPWNSGSHLDTAVCAHTHLAGCCAGVCDPHGTVAASWTLLPVHTPTWLTAVQVCAPREMVVEQTWREEEDGTVIVLFHTTRHRYAREAPRAWFGSWWQPVRAQVTDLAALWVPCMLLQPPASACLNVHMRSQSKKNSHKAPPMHMYCDCAWSNPSHTLHSARAGDGSTAPTLHPDLAPVPALHFGTSFRPCTVQPTETRCSAPAAHASPCCPARSLLLGAEVGRCSRAALPSGCASPAALQSAAAGDPCLPWCQQVHCSSAAGESPCCPADRSSWVHHLPPAAALHGQRGVPGVPGHPRAQAGPGGLAGRPQPHGLGARAHHAAPEHQLCGAAAHVGCLPEGQGEWLAVPVAVAAQGGSSSRMAWALAPITQRLNASI